MYAQRLANKNPAVGKGTTMGKWVPKYLFWNYHLLPALHYKPSLLVHWWCKMAHWGALTWKEEGWRGGLSHREGAREGKRQGRYIGREHQKSSHGGTDGERDSKALLLGTQRQVWTTLAPSLSPSLAPSGTGLPGTLIQLLAPPSPKDPEWSRPLQPSWQEWSIREGGLIFHLHMKSRPAPTAQTSSRVQRDISTNLQAPPTSNASTATYAHTVWALQLSMCVCFLSAWVCVDKQLGCAAACTVCLSVCERECMRMIMFYVCIARLRFNEQTVPHTAGVSMLVCLQLWYR